MNTLAEQEFAFVAAQLTTEELEELERRVVSGEIEGKHYIDGHCGCFYGSIALIRGVLSPVDWADAGGECFRDELLSDANGQFGTRITALEDRVYQIGLGDMPEDENTDSIWLHGLLTAEIARRNAQ